VGRRKEKKRLFEKEKQKTFVQMCPNPPSTGRYMQILVDKVFLFLFVYKKKILSASPPIDFA